MDANALEKYIGDLNAAADAFEYVEYNLREGVEFYASVNTVLIQCQERVTDYVFARAEEKAAEMAQLNQTGMANTYGPHSHSHVQYSYR